MNQFAVLLSYQNNKIESVSSNSIYKKSLNISIVNYMLRKIINALL